MIETSEFEAIWIDGIVQWIYQICAEGWKPYYINIMFKPLSGSTDQLLTQMRRAIERGFYPRLIQNFVHHPRAPAEQCRLPKLILFPDLAVWKHKKVSLRQFLRNETLHYNGPMLVPPASRLKYCPIDLINSRQQAFTVGGIERIHLKEMSHIGGCVDYSAKSVKNGGAGEDGIIVLPRSLNEVRPGAMPRQDKYTQGYIS